MRRRERCQTHINYPICFLQARWMRSTYSIFSMEYLSLDWCYHRGSLKGFQPLKVQYNHSQSTGAGAECQRSASLGSTLARHLLPSQSTDTALQGPFHTDTLAFLLSYLWAEFLLIWGAMEGKITLPLIIKSPEKIRHQILSPWWTD